MITDGVTGFLVPPEDEDALAARLIELLSDTNKARRMGEAGRKRAREYFTWPATVERINNVMEGVKRP
jgi:glycosyltransferase involved in cell wall biosynthesis